MGTMFILAIRGRVRESREARARAMVLRGASVAQMEEALAFWDLWLAFAGSPDTASGRRAYEFFRSRPDSTVFFRDWMGLYAARAGEWSQVDRWIRRANAVVRSMEVQADTVRARAVRAEVRLLKAVVAEHRGDSTGVLKELEAARRDYPIWWSSSDETARSEIARRLLSRGDLRGAQRYLQSLVAGERLMYPLLEYQLGQVSEGLGDPEQAKYHYSQMVRWWQGADPEFKPLWEEGRRALARVTEEQ
jgi:hypothetical protein